MALGLLSGCEPGGPSVDDATVTIQEPGDAILDADAQDDQPADAP